MTRSTCPECDAGLEPGDQTCQGCGAPLSFTPGQDGVGCRVSGAVIGAYAETCPRCGENGYPALRPRKGKGFEGAPGEEAGA